jgi:hypothetical protein
MTIRGTRLLLLLSCCLAGAAPGDRPLTRAEQTEYKETSRYEDVMSFLNYVSAKPGPVVVTTIGKSTEGRDIPLAIASRPTVASAAEARKSGKLIVYIQANIHAGEVEGKEAAQMVLREVWEKPDHPWLDELVLLVAPIYNIDGNEKWGDGARVRGSQDGPARIGQRENGAGLDLNRDAMKAESPEMRAVLQHVYNTWDPEVCFDLHTTNGTRHGYHLTYSPPLNPNTNSGVTAYARDDLLPAVRAQLDPKFKLFDYGNLQGRNEKRGWYTFGEEGRYVTNYIGLRNRVSILSEAASFLPFRDRVASTLAFVRAVLDKAAQDSEKIRGLTHAADLQVEAWGKQPEKAPQLGIRFEFAERPTRPKEPVPIEVVKPGQVVDHHKAPEQTAIQELTVFDRFRPTRTTHFPSGYVLPPSLANVAELLKRHGIVVETLKEPWRGSAEEFLIEGLTPTGRFQRRAMSRLEGRFIPNPEASSPAGSFRVSTAHPLGILAFMLLEPESLDGVAAWGFLEGSIGEKTVYPILKLASPR